ncbi:hypothetical protein CVT24_011550, partial [Panaeolus cyanescens]
GQGGDDDDDDDDPHAPKLSDFTKGLPQFANSLGADFETSAFRWGAKHATSTGRVAYFRQAYHGIPFSNAVGNIAWSHDQVVAYGSSFVDLKETKLADSTPTIRIYEVIPKIEQELDGKLSGPDPKLEYVLKGADTAVLTYKFQIHNVLKSMYLGVNVDAHTGEIVRVVDYSSQATYTAVPVDKMSIADGYEDIVDPEDLEASPYGWHHNGTYLSDNTSGNNVLAGWLGSDNVTEFLPQAVGNLTFKVTFNQELEPTTPTNANASAINAFYLLNKLHDITYRYGFTEIAFNFQANNFGKGEKGGDPIIAIVQDKERDDNASFATLPDGQPGICRAHLFKSPNPDRDAAMANDVMAHEFGHGLTNRMVGGGTAECLNADEARSMGEGWGDALANWLQQSSADVTDFVIGAYLDDSPKGFRQYPYSVHRSVNPLTYASIPEKRVPHGVGEIWANMLHNVYAALVKEKGFSHNKFTDVDGLEGNIIWMHLYMDSLLLMPCNPSFVDARNAWIQADENRYDGEHFCLLWREFAKRGLGTRADDTYTDSNYVPRGCGTRDAV